MASMVTDAQMVLANDLEILELEPPCASAKSKETKEVSLNLDDPTKTVKIRAHLNLRCTALLGVYRKTSRAIS